MPKVLVLYKTPKSAEAFDKHYMTTHVPLAKKIPGLKSYDISRGPVNGPADGRSPCRACTRTSATSPTSPTRIAGCCST